MQVVQWNIKVTPRLDQIVEEAVTVDLHSTKSEFIKDAVRFYLEQKFPHLVDKLRAGELEKRGG